MQKRIYVYTAVLVAVFITWAILYRHYMGPVSGVISATPGVAENNSPPQPLTEQEMKEWDEEWGKMVKDWMNANSKPHTFRSEKLGVTFSYMSPFGYYWGARTQPILDSYNIEVKEEGNKIFVNRENTKTSERAPGIEVFEKEADATLMQAALKILPNLDPEKCYTNATGGTFELYSEVLYDSFFRRDRSLYPDGLYISLSCGTKGMVEGADGVMLTMNVDVPTKFLQLRHSQDILTYDAGGKNSWNNSIRVFK